MSKLQTTPPRLRQDPIEAGFFEEIRDRTNVAEVTAVATAPISVDSADASDLATVITLANELKGDVNNLVTALNNGGAKLNEVIAAMQAAKLMDS